MRVMITNRENNGIFLGWILFLNDVWILFLDNISVKFNFISKQRQNHIVVKKISMKISLVEVEFLFVSDNEDNNEKRSANVEV